MFRAEGSGNRENPRGYCSIKVPAKCQCIEFEGKYFTEIGRRSELLETGMEVSATLLSGKAR